MDARIKHHITPVLCQANDSRVLIKGKPLSVPFRIMAEEEYQLLLAGFKKAGGRVQ